MIMQYPISCTNWESCCIDLVEACCCGWRNAGAILLRLPVIKSTTDLCEEINTVDATRHHRVHDAQRSLRMTVDAIEDKPKCGELPLTAGGEATHTEVEHQHHEVDSAISSDPCARGSILTAFSKKAPAWKTWCKEEVCKGLRSLSARKWKEWCKEEVCKRPLVVECAPPRQLSRQPARAAQERKDPTHARLMRTRLTREAVTVKLSPYYQITCPAEPILLIPGPTRFAQEQPNPTRTRTCY
jgi:hypothetical protein